MAFDSILGSAIGGLASLGGSALSASAAKSINAQNIEMQRETNRQNRQMFDDQLAWTENMWHQNNSWNLEQWLRERAAAVEDRNFQAKFNSLAYKLAELRRFGINPAFALGGVGSQDVGLPSVGSARSSAPSSPSAIAASAPHADFVPNVNLEGIANSINSYFQNELVANQSSAVRDANRRENQLQPERVKHLQAQAKLTGVQGSVARMELAYLRATQTARTDAAFNDVELQRQKMQHMREQILGQQVQNRLLQIEERYKPRMSELELKKASMMLNSIQASIALTYAQRDLTVQQKITEVERQINQTIHNGIDAIEYKNQSEFAHDLRKIGLEAAREALYTQQQQNWFTPLDKYQQYTGKAAEWFPKPALQYNAAEEFERNIRRYKFKR